MVRTTLDYIELRFPTLAKGEGRGGGGGGGLFSYIGEGRWGD